MDFEREVNKVKDQIYDILDELGIHPIHIRNPKFLNGKIIFEGEFTLEKSNKRYHNFDFIDDDYVFYEGERQITEAVNQKLKERGEPIELVLEAPDEARDLLDTLHESYRRIVEEQKINLRAERGSPRASNIFHPTFGEDCKAAIVAIADQQRERPEQKMLEYANTIGGSELSSLLEHVGDIIHRVSQRTYIQYEKPEMALTNIIPKIVNAIRTLSRPNFLDNMKNEIESNYNYNSQNKEFKEQFPTLEDFKKRSNQLLKEYAFEHGKIKPLNPFQALCVQATTNLGKQNFDKVLECLIKMDEIIQKVEFIPSVSSCDFNGAAPPPPSACTNTNGVSDLMESVSGRKEDSVATTLINFIGGGNENNPARKPKPKLN